MKLVFLKKVVLGHMLKIFTLFYSPKVYYHVCKSLALDPILTEMNPIHGLTTYFYKVLITLSPNLI
jgi:hypothetical protein